MARLKILFKKYNTFILDGLLFLVLTVIFCLKFFHDHFIFQGDVFHSIFMQNYPKFLHQGWNPHAFGYLGWYPIAGTWFPLNLFMQFFIELFGNNPRITLLLLQINALLSLFLLGFFTYVLFRFLERSRTAAIIGAIIVTFTGFHVQAGLRELNLFFLHSFLFVPLSLLFMIKAIREKSIKWILLSGILIGISFLGGINVPMFMYLPVFIFVYMIDKPLKNILNAKDFLGTAVYVAIASVIGVIIASVIVLPALKYMNLTVRSSIVTRTISTKTPGFLYTLTTMFFRDWWLDRWPLRDGLFLPFHELDSFIGLPGLILCIIGIIQPFHKIKGKWFMILLGLFALVFMHIGSMPFFIRRPYQFVFSTLGMRLPYRSFLVLLLPVAFFAACGVDSITKFFRHSKKTSFLLITGIAVFAYLCIGVKFYCRVTMPELHRSFFSVLILTFVFSLLLVFPCIKKLRRGFSQKVIYRSLMIVVFLFYYFASSDTPVRKNYGEKHIQHAHHSAFLYPGTVQEVFQKTFDNPLTVWKSLSLEEKEPFRVFHPRRSLRNKTGFWAPQLNIDLAFEPNSYDDPSNPKDFTRYYKLFSQSTYPFINDFDSPLIDLYNVKYLCLDDYNGRKFIKTPFKNIYKNPYAFDRFFVTYGAKYFDSEDKLFTELGKASYRELRNHVFLLRKNESEEDVTSHHEQENEEVKIVERKSTRILLEVTMQESGHLVASEFWFPAWIVKDSEKTTELRKAYGAFRAVALEKGFHRIEFIFRDWYGLWGKFTTAFTLIILGLFLYTDNKKDVNNR